MTDDDVDLTPEQKIAAINDLQNQIDALKRGTSYVNKKQKTSHSNAADEYSNEMPVKQGRCGVLPGDDIVVSMLKRENELRLSDEVQRRFAEAERSGTTDWIEVACSVQKEVLREYNVDFSECTLHAYRCAANKHQVSLYVKHNRAREGDLRVGSNAPNVSVVSIEENGSTRSQPLLEFQQRDRPLVVIAGSLS